MFYATERRLFRVNFGRAIRKKSSYNPAIQAGFAAACRAAPAAFRPQRRNPASAAAKLPGSRRIHEEGRMKTSMRAAAVAGALAAFAGSAGAAPLVPGNVAPNFTKTQLGGGSVSLSDYSGKVVLLFFLGYS